MASCRFHLFLQRSRRNTQSQHLSPWRKQKNPPSYGGFFPDLYHSVGRQAKNEKGQFSADPYNPRQYTGYDRPKLNAKTQEEIYKNYKPLPNGDYWDIKNNKLIEAPIDIGHGYGLEHRRLALAAEEVGLTQQEFNKFVNSHPEYFRIENAPRNRGHLDEKPGRNDIEDIVDEMQAFIKQER